MRSSALVKGLSVGIAAGTACYVFAGASSKQRRQMKRKTGKALRAIGTMMEGVSAYFN